MSDVTTLAIGGTANVGTGFGTIEYFVHEIDLAEAVAAGLATTDQVTIVNVPADTYVDFRQAEVVTALGDTVTRVDIGDAAADTTFVENATTVTAGTNFTLAVNGKQYAAADAIKLKITGSSIDSGIVRVVFGMLDTSRIAVGDSPDL